MELYLLHNSFIKEKRNRLYRDVILHIPKIQFTRLRNGCKLDTKWIIIKFRNTRIHIKNVNNFGY
jgi:hypothetical protein